jgi:opacity protein-like surface antigen
MLRDRFFALIVCCASLPFGALAHAEWYVAGQIGATIPNELTGVKGTGAATGIDSSDLTMQNSVVYGAKLGYYFDSMKWLGLETEVFNSTPHVKQQSVVLNGVNVGVLPGAYQRVLTWAPVVVKARFTEMGSFQPYVGVGLGVSFARLNDGAGTTASSNARPGLVTQVGLNYLVTSRIALFTEWKFHYVNLDYKDSLAPGAGLSADYTAHHLVAGLGFHF